MRDAAPAPGTETRGHADLLHIGEPSSPAAEAAAAGAPIGHGGLIEKACEVMHDAYEAAAQGFGWDTQQASRKPWADVPEANKATMRAAVKALLGWLAGMDTLDRLDSPAPGEPGEGADWSVPPPIANDGPMHDIDGTLLPGRGLVDPATGEPCSHTHAHRPGACVYCERDHATLDLAAARAEAAGLRERVAEATRTMVALHCEFGDGTCRDCCEPYPCPTLDAIAALRTTP